MVLNVVDDRGVVCESPAGPNCLVALGVCSNIPVVTFISCESHQILGFSCCALPKSNSLILTACREVTGYMRVPAKPEAFSFMA